MKTFFVRYQSYWILNIAAVLASGAISYGAISILQWSRGEISGSYLGQILFYPGTFMVTWAAITFFWFRMGWLSEFYEGFIRLNSRSIPLKALAFVLLLILTKALGISSTSSLFGYSTAVILIFLFGICDRWLVDSARTPSNIDKIIAGLFVFIGLILVILGTPIYGVLVR